MHLERLLRILEVSALSGRQITVAEIAAATGFPKPSCYRLVQDLVNCGLFVSPEKGRFQIGDRLHRIAKLDRSDADIAVLATPALQELADDFGVACFLSRMRSTGVEITHVVPPKDARVSFLHPGLGYRPMHACSCAKVIAAYSEGAFIQQLYSEDLRSFTAFTTTNTQELRDELSAIRDRGYGECVQELELGICSVAAPVKFEGIGVGFSVGATGSIRVFTPEFRASIAQALVTLADALTENMGNATTSDILESATGASVQPG